MICRMGLLEELGTWKKRVGGGSREERRIWRYGGVWGQFMAHQKYRPQTQQCAAGCRSIIISVILTATHFRHTYGI